MTRFLSVLAFALLGLSARADAQPSSAQVPRVFVDAAAPEEIRSADQWPAVAVGVRLTVALPDGLTPELDRLMATLASRQVPVWVAIAVPTDPSMLASWQDAVRELIRRYASRLRIVEVLVPEAETPLRRFAVQIVSTEARSRLQRMVIIAVGGRDTAVVEAFAATMTAEHAPYVDALALPGTLSPAALQAFESVVPGGRVLRHSLEAGRDGDGRRRIVREALNTLGTTTAASAWRGNPTEVISAARALTSIGELLLNPIEVLDPDAVGLQITAAGASRRADVPARVLFDEQTFATYVVYEGSPPPAGIDLSLRLPIEGTPTVLDVLEGGKGSAAGYRRDAVAARSQVTVPLTGRPMIVNFSEGATDLFAQRTAASAERLLSIDEVIARHRQYQTRLDEAVRNYRASALMQQHFRPSLTDPGYDVVTENNYFVSDDGVEFEELSFSVNGSKWGADRPAFPLLQAEKVLSLPLELRLSEDYRYSLAGIERVGDTDCYRVRFDPLRDDEALYRGTVWIDRQTFARVKVQAVQTRTTPPIVSNEEIHLYEPVTTVGGLPLMLLTRLTSRQIVLIAGRNLLLEKAAAFSDFSVNAADFEDRRQAARRGDRIMYRDTDRGLRYYVKEGDGRVVSERATTRARAMAMGLLIDPSFGYPLPIFGLNVLDFEFRGRPDTQFALLFAGVLAAGNLQRPRLGGTPLDASFDFFAIAPPASDRLYVSAGEREEERLLTWPLSAGVNLGWQYTPFQKALLQYQFRFDGYVRDRTTSETFVTPSSTTTNGLGGAWEYKRGGYSVAANATWFARSEWRPWGPADAVAPDPPRTYAKYAVHLSRDFFLDVIQKVHLNASYFGGRDLDRFSRYQFGLFDDTRIHGVPASGVRFDRLGMIRGSYSLNIFEQYRLDLFADQAWGEDRTIDQSWRPLTGLGAAVNLRAPRNTILRVDVGKSVLPGVYREVGSFVLQVMLLKPLS
jgi:hypothetical protein